MILLASSFFAMGGYGAFIWGAYGGAAIAIGGLVLVSLAQHRSVRRALAARGLERRR
jgi:heme exporter protein CcmD